MTFPFAVFTCLSFVGKPLDSFLQMLFYSVLKALNRESFYKHVNVFKKNTIQFTFNNKHSSLSTTSINEQMVAQITEVLLLFLPFPLRIE